MQREEGLPLYIDGCKLTTRSARSGLVFSVYMYEWLIRGVLGGGGGGGKRRRGRVRAERCRLRGSRSQRRRHRSSPAGPTPGRCPSLHGMSALLNSPEGWYLAGLWSAM